MAFAFNGVFYEIAPTSHPMPAVIAIARPPHNVTRIEPIVTLAPTARAASPPIRARTASDDRETHGFNRACGAIAVTVNGIEAPRATLQAAARDACNGCARNFLEILSSSRAYAPNTGTHADSQFDEVAFWFVICNSFTTCFTLGTDKAICSARERANCALTSPVRVTTPFLTSYWTAF